MGVVIRRWSASGIWKMIKHTGTATSAVVGIMQNGIEMSRRKCNYCNNVLNKVYCFANFSAIICSIVENYHFDKTSMFMKSQ
jgi:hypothetical protein